MIQYFKYSWFIIFTSYHFFMYDNFFFLFPVVMIGFGDTTYSVGEERPFDIEVRLFNDIVSGRSATVSVAEQSQCQR